MYSLLDTLEYVPIMKHQNSVSVDLMVNFLPYDPMWEYNLGMCDSSPAINSSRNMNGKHVFPS